MTQQIFEKILDENDITWNDIVTLTVINPKYVKGIFNWSRQPKTISFNGALGYHWNDEYISLMVMINDECTDLKFSFDEVVSIRKNKNYETRR
jgi:hypothetical protein